jgi:hypothetical protein
MILCAVDDSEAAEGVLDTARWLAEDLQARLVVMHVVDDRSHDADKIVARVRARLGDEHAEVRLVSGSPVEVILAAADCVRPSWAASPAIWPPGRASPSWSSHPVGSRPRETTVQPRTARVWCAAWMAQSRHWPGPCSRGGSHGDFTAGWWSFTPAKM